MSLINEIMWRPLDPDYADAAESRRRAGLQPSTGYRTPTLIVAVLLIGALLAIAGLSLRVPTTAAKRAKDQLISEIEARRTHGDAQTLRVQRLRAEIDQMQAQALEQGQSDLATELRRVQLLTGAVPVTGPGVTLTMDDAKAQATGQGNAVDPRASAEADQGRVIARDLQIVVNGLWEAGAEAIAVNGERLTSRAAIRFAGQAILVNYRPLTRPYVITAIGDRNSLPAEFAGTAGGGYLQSLTDNYGIRSSLKATDRLVLPGDSSLAVREARPGADTGANAPTSTNTSTNTSTTTTTTTPETAP